MENLFKNLADISPDKRELLEYLLKEQGLDPLQLLPIPKSRETGPCPLSFAQQRLWFINQFEPNSPLYNIPAAFRLVGELDAAALARSLDELLRRH